mmetsp:Transcript_5169/g.10459  ORF Transcript_5169/g.10459 Transcript_5169/m.10459 type:complete len:108 (-) Transcript_5169:814-1137(-)
MQTLKPISGGCNTIPLPRYFSQVFDCHALHMNNPLWLPQLLPPPLNSLVLVLMSLPSVMPLSCLLPLFLVNELCGVLCPLLDTLVGLHAATIFHFHSSNPSLAKETL